MQRCAKESCCKEGIKRCMRCFSEWYCSKECQRAQWSHHKIFCNLPQTPVDDPEEPKNKVKEDLTSLGKEYTRHYSPSDLGKKMTNKQQVLSKIFDADAFRTLEKTIIRLSEHFGGEDKIPKDIIEELKKHKKAETIGLVNMQVNNLIGMMTGFKLEDEYDDGDQNKLYGDEATQLQMQWGRGFDYYPVENPKLSGWCKALFLGCVDDVKRYIQKANKGSIEELIQLLNKRESMLRAGGVLHVLIGAGKDPSPRYLEVLKIILDAGANPNIKDCLGQTGLHHCVTNTIMGIELATLLLEYGANIDAQNRLGYVPLMFPFKTANLELAEFLICNGANVSIKSHFTGFKCDYFASEMNPKLHAIISRGMRVQAKKDKDKLALTNAACILCTKSGILKRCTGCFSVSYCGADCQKSHWKDHKAACTTKNSSKIVIVKKVGSASNTCTVTYSKKKKALSKKSEKTFSDLEKAFKIKIRVI